MNETDDRPSPPGALTGQAGPLTGSPGALTTVCTYVEQNPIAAIIQAIAAGFVAGLIIRWLERPAPRKIDIKHKPDLEEAKFHLGSLLLPFLWPAWQKTRRTYGDSAESLQEAVAQLKKSGLGKAGQKKAAAVAKWADEELAFLAKLGRKQKKQLLAWLEDEASELAKTGKEKVKEIGEWVDDEVVPTAEAGWKKLRKLCCCK